VRTGRFTCIAGTPVMTGSAAAAAAAGCESKMRRRRRRLSLARCCGMLVRRLRRRVFVPSVSRHQGWF